MNLSEPFIRRPVMTSIVMFAILIFGFMSYKRLPVSDLPNVDYPTINVTASLPGASPETMASTVATPLERSFINISGLKTISSNNTQGSTSIVLQFNLEKNIDVAAQEIQAAIAKTLPLLPANMTTNPSYEKVNPSKSPIMYLVLTSDTLNFADLYQMGNVHIGQRLSMIEGVAQVQTYGTPYAIRIQIDSTAIASRQLDINTVSRAIIAGSPSLATGSISSYSKKFSIQTAGQLLSAQAFESLIVDYRDGAPIYIRDIGKSVDSLSNNGFNMRYITKEENTPAIMLAISRQPGANTVKVAEAIQKFLPQIQKDLPHSVNLKVILDKAVNIKAAVNDVKFNLILSFVLVVVVIFLSLGKIVDTIIPTIVLPMSVIGTFSAMYLLDFSADTLSLLALTLSLGFIIDDAIVVLENIVRHTELGETPYQAALIGSRQISVTVFTMTVALCAVFIPMLFMSGLLGRLFNEFAITLVGSILFSGFISLSLTPMLCSRFVPALNKDLKERKKNLSSRMHDRLLHQYQRSLKHTLKYQKTLVSIALVCLLSTIIIFKLLPTDFFPSEDIGFIVGFLDTGTGTTGKITAKYQNELNQIFKEEPAIRDFVSAPGGSDGLFFIRLKQTSERNPMAQVLSRLNQQIKQLAGMNVYLNSVSLIDFSTGGEKGNYDYVLQSIDQEKLYQYSQIMLREMQKLPGFASVSSNLKLENPQLNVKLLRDPASTYGFTAFDIENALRNAYSGGRVTTIQLPGAQYDVILELLPQFKSDPSDLNSIYLKSSSTNAMVPLAELAEWKTTVGPSEVDHLNQLPAVTLSFSLKDGVPLGEGMDQLNRLAYDTLPPSITGSLTGTAQEFEQTISDLIFLTFVAVIVIYMLLGILYESFILPFTILSALPIAGLGALITLAIFGQPISLYAFVGIILLLGLVQKNGIILVDHANHVMQTPGKSAEEAIFEACSVRFRPIIMTSVAAIVGGLPLALGYGTGGEARRPLGLAIVGGLIFSQLLTLYITPVVFLYFEKLREFLQRKFGNIRDNHE